MSFRIVDILKIPNKYQDESKHEKHSTFHGRDFYSDRSQPSQVTHFHNDFDDIGALLPNTLRCGKQDERKQLKNKYKNYDKHQFKKSDFYQEEDTSLSARELLCNTLAQTTTASASSTAKMTSSSSSSSISASYKKRRILFTREQTHELQKVFQCQQYLTVPQRDYLSRKINLSPTQVKIWFQNHRYKLKKYLKECTVKSPSSTSKLLSEPVKDLTISYRHNRSSLYITEHTLFPGRCDSTCSVPLKSPQNSPLLNSPEKQFSTSRWCSCSDDRCSFIEKEKSIINKRHFSSRYHSNDGNATLCDCDIYPLTMPPSSTKWNRPSESYDKLVRK